MSVEKNGWEIQKSLFPQTNQVFIFSYTRENSKMFNITSTYFSFFNNKPPVSWVVHITRDFLTCYSCSYYSSMVTRLCTLHIVNRLHTFLEVVNFYRRWWLLKKLYKIYTDGYDNNEYFSSKIHSIFPNDIIWCLSMSRNDGATGLEPTTS